MKKLYLCQFINLLYNYNVIYQKVYAQNSIQTLLPFYGLLRNAQNKTVCAGILIKSKILLTSAYCLINNNINHIIFNNNTTLNETKGEQVKIQNILIHEDYTKDQQDIGLIELEKDIIFNEIIQLTDFIPIGNNIEFNIISTDIKCKDKINHEFHKISFRLDPSISFNTTNNIFYLEPFIQYECQGDFGSPIFSYDHINNKYLIYGLFIQDNNDVILKSIQSIGLKIYKFNSWINREIMLLNSLRFRSNLLQIRSLKFNYLTSELFNKGLIVDKYGFIVNVKYLEDRSREKLILYKEFIETLIEKLDNVEFLKSKTIFIINLVLYSNLKINQLIDLNLPLIKIKTLNITNVDDLLNLYWSIELLTPYSDSIYKELISQEKYIVKAISTSNNEVDLLKLKLEVFLTKIEKIKKNSKLYIYFKEKLDMLVKLEITYFGFLSSKNWNSTIMDVFIYDFNELININQKYFWYELKYFNLDKMIQKRLKLSDVVNQKIVINLQELNINNTTETDKILMKNQDLDCFINQFKFNHTMMKSIVKNELEVGHLILNLRKEINDLEARLIIIKSLLKEINNLNEDLKTKFSNVNKIKNLIDQYFDLNLDRYYKSIYFLALESNFTNQLNFYFDNSTFIPFKRGKKSTVYRILLSLNSDKNKIKKRLLSLNEKTLKILNGTVNYIRLNKKLTNYKMNGFRYRLTDLGILSNNFKHKFDLFNITNENQLDSIKRYTKFLDEIKNIETLVELKLHFNYLISTLKDFILQCKKSTNPNGEILNFLFNIELKLKDVECFKANSSLSQFMQNLKDNITKLNKILLDLIQYKLFNSEYQMKYEESIIFFYKNLTQSLANKVSMEANKFADHFAKFNFIISQFHNNKPDFYELYHIDKTKSSIYQLQSNYTQIKNLLFSQKSTLNIKMANIAKDIYPEILKIFQAQKFLNSLGEKSLYLIQELNYLFRKYYHQNNFIYNFSHIFNMVCSFLYHLI